MVGSEKIANRKQEVIEEFEIENSEQARFCNNPKALGTTRFFEVHFGKSWRGQPGPGWRAVLAVPRLHLAQRSFKENYAVTWARRGTAGELHILRIGCTSVRWTQPLI